MPHKHLIIWDMDDTLFHSDTAIVVMDGKEEIVKILTTDEFKKYALAEGESFSFAYLNCAETFAKSAQPIRETHKLFQQHQASAKALNVVDLIICTARQSFDKHDVFLKTLEGHAIDVSIVKVECAGDHNLDSSAECKALAISKYLDTGDYESVSMYDDDRRNLMRIERLVGCYKGINYYPYVVSTSGQIHPFIGSITSKT